ncbi:hypothetical protein PoB_005582800 [Plakobranchus ocellatus]|uniref:Uncharacterized protein n=1 Tax=Plakobranchus ocellatus TaxID=259542 RepID=A0AAV4CED8_9GAST|nr:hypothetical protein PoB_005582800 [Plakobranchus ocellatus]
MGKQNQSLPEHPNQPELLGESGSGDTRLQDNNALSRLQRIFSRAILTSFFLCTACHISHTQKRGQLRQYQKCKRNDTRGLEVNAVRLRVSKNFV